MSYDGEWAALMRAIKTLGVGLHDVNATRFHKGDPEECCRVMRLLLFEISREVSYQMVHLEYCPSSSDAKLVQTAFRYLHHQSCYSPKITIDEFLYKNCNAEKFVVLRKLAIHIQSYVSSKGHTVAPLAAHATAPQVTTSRRRLGVIRGLYDDVVFARPESLSSTESDSNINSSVSSGSTDNGSKFKSSPNRAILQDEGTSFSHRAPAAGLGGYFDSTDDEDLPRPPPPLSPVQMKLGSNTFNVCTGGGLGNTLISSEGSEANSVVDCSGSGSSSSRGAGVSAQPLGSSLAAAVDTKGHLDSLPATSTSYLNKYDQLYGSTAPNPRRRYIPSSDLKIAQAETSQVPSYLSRYLHPTGEDCSSCSDPAKVKSTREGNIVKEESAKQENKLVSDDIWIFRDGTAHNRTGGVGGSSDLYYTAKDTSQASIDPLIGAFGVEEGRVDPQEPLSRSWHSTGIDYSYKNNRMVTKRSTKVSVQDIKAKASISSSPLNESQVSHISMSTNAIARGRSAVAYPGRTFCTFCKQYGETKTCCGLPAATVYHPHSRPKGQRRGDVKLAVWPWQIESDISYERVAGVQLHENDIVYDYVDKHFAVSGHAPLSFTACEETCSSIPERTCLQGPASDRDSHRYMYSDAKSENKDNASVHDQINKPRRKTTSEYFSFQAGPTGPSPSNKANTYADTDYSGGKLMAEELTRRQTHGDTKVGDGHLEAVQAQVAGDNYSDKAFFSASLNGGSTTRDWTNSPLERRSYISGKAPISAAGDLVHNTDLWRKQELFDGVHANYINTLQRYRHSVEGDMRFMNDQIKRLEKMPTA